jgi:hypothetical protein
LFRIRDVYPGSEVFPSRIPGQKESESASKYFNTNNFSIFSKLSYPDFVTHSQIQGSKRHRIPDPQHRFFADFCKTSNVSQNNRSLVRSFANEDMLCRARSRSSRPPRSSAWSPLSCSRGSDTGQLYTYRQIQPFAHQSSESFSDPSSLFVLFFFPLISQELILNAAIRSFE